jgi:hypothetical protein
MCVAQKICDPLSRIHTLKFLGSFIPHTQYRKTMTSFDQQHDALIKSLQSPLPHTLKAVPVPVDFDRDVFCVTVDNVLTAEECASFIELSETKGFEEALVNVGGGRQRLIKDFRDSHRAIFDSPEIAEAIFQRVKQFIPSRFCSMNAVGINERMRVLRYSPGHVFHEHFDGSFVRGYEAGERRNEASLITVQLYLNQGFKGGATRLLDGPYDVIPKTGRVLLFQHDILHEGSVLLEGRKYTVRSDVMYSVKGPGWEYSSRPIVCSAFTASDVQYCPQPNVL